MVWSLPVLFTCCFAPAAAPPTSASLTSLQAAPQPAAGSVFQAAVQPVSSVGELLTSATCPPGPPVSPTTVAHGPRRPVARALAAHNASGSSAALLAAELSQLELLPLAPRRAFEWDFLAHCPANPTGTAATFPHSSRLLRVRILQPDNHAVSLQRVDDELLAHPNLARLFLQTLQQPRASDPREAAGSSAKFSRAPASMVSSEPGLSGATQGAPAAHANPGSSNVLHPTYPASSLVYSRRSWADPCIILESAVSEALPSSTHSGMLLGPATTLEALLPCCAALAPSHPAVVAIEELPHRVEPHDEEGTLLAAIQAGRFGIGRQLSFRQGGACRPSGDGSVASSSGGGLPTAHIEASYQLGALLRCALDIACGLAHLHSLAILHGDLSPMSIYLVELPVASAPTEGAGVSTQSAGDRLSVSGGRCVLSGYGLSSPVTQAASLRANLALWREVVYLAPEAVQGEQPAGLPADIYAFGATLYHMATGRPPYHNHLPAQVVVGLAGGAAGLTLEWPPYVVRELRQLIDACMLPDPAHRPPAAEVVAALTAAAAEHLSLP